MNKIESTSLKDVLCQGLVEIGLMVLEKKIFKSCQFIFIISQLSPFCEGRDPSFEKVSSGERKIRIFSVEPENM